MQIVIEIDENTYKRIQALAKDDYFEHDICGNSMQRIANGTPLPKHGRLIDADAIEYTHAIARCLEDGHNWNELCVTENELYEAPTIIEANDIDIDVGSIEREG